MIREQKVEFWVLLAAVMLIPVGSILWVMVPGIRFSVRQQRHLQQAIAQDLPEIARACAALAATGQERILAGGDPELPPVILRMECSDVDVCQDRITIEMQGGFDHFGLAVIRSSRIRSGVKRLRSYPLPFFVLLYRSNQSQ